MRPARNTDAVDSGGAGTLVTGVLCTLLGLLIAAHAVGAVVPVVGDALGVAHRGIGYLLGYLLGAGLFGLFGLLLLAAGWSGRTQGRAARDAENEPPASFSVGPRRVLPDGPGLAARWSVAVPLMLVAVFGPVVATAAYRAWGDIQFGLLVQAVDGRAVPAFGTAFRENLATGWFFLVPATAITAGFLLRRDRMASWSTACLGNAVFALAGSGAISSLAVGGDSTPLMVASFVAVLGAAYWLGRLAEAVLSRPVAADVVGGGLEIAFRLPRQLPRLRVQEDRLVLDRLRRWDTGSGTARLATRFTELTDVRGEVATSATRWSATTGRTPSGRTREICVPAGPVVRIEAGKRTWLLPARSELAAQTIVTVIAARAHR